MTDIMFPLSGESKNQNLELRLALRSIAKYAQNVGNIWIYSAVELPWVKNANVIVMGDPCKNCKDVNLINKVKACAKNKDVSQKFMFWSDDQVLTAPLDLDKAPVVANPRGLDFFAAEEKVKKANKWHQRMLHTLQHVKKETGMELQYNFDSHVPQPYDKNEVLDVFSNVPYTDQPGFCINTIYYGMLRKPFTMWQSEAKHNFEKPEVVIPKEMKLYAGYNDAAWGAGLAYFLLGRFYEPCKYENA